MPVKTWRLLFGRYRRPGGGTGTSEALSIWSASVSELGMEAIWKISRRFPGLYLVDDKEP